MHGPEPSSFRLVEQSVPMLTLQGRTMLSDAVFLRSTLSLQAHTHQTLGLLGSRAMHIEGLFNARALFLHSFTSEQCDVDFRPSRRSMLLLETRRERLVFGITKVNASQMGKIYLVTQPLWHRVGVGLRQ